MTETPFLKSDPSDDELAVEAERLLSELGTRPVINAAGAYTMLGGSSLAPEIRAVMDAVNHRYADMKILLEGSGRVIAEMLDAEAAYVTSGAAASLALSVAACLTAGHPEYLERLPHTEGIPNEVLVQKNSRQKYDRCLTVPGARIVEVGDESGLTAGQLRDAIGPRSVAVHYLAPGFVAGTPPLEGVVEVAHARGLPVIVDAAGQTYPVDSLRKYARAGADLVCYAGKYFDAPQSTGLIVGRKDLVEVAALNGFIGFETSGTYTFGRPMKVDRQEIVATVAALRRWLSLDHEARLNLYGGRIDVLLQAVRDLPGVEAYRISERETPAATVRDGVRLLLGPSAACDADRVADALREGEPSIWVRSAGDAINVSVGFMQDGDVEVVARRLREVLSA
jgi:D-glucosaminate-6-phosphate ammonia-lyase